MRKRDRSAVEVPNRIHASMNGDQLAGPSPISNRPLTQAQRQELRARHVPVLPDGQPGDFRCGMTVFSHLRKRR